MHTSALNAAAGLVFTHSDYRTCNFLYDETTLNITSALDWEPIHIGDYYQDQAWAAISTWSTVKNGTLLASGLLVDELRASYTESAGRLVNPKYFNLYQVLGLYKCVAICLAILMNAARHGYNHRASFLPWLGAAGYSFLSDPTDLLERVEA